MWRAEGRWRMYEVRQEVCDVCGKKGICVMIDYDTECEHCCNLEELVMLICHNCLCDMKNDTTPAGWCDKPMGHER